MKNKYLILILLGVITLSSCATYYQKNIKFQEYISNGEMERAREFLEKSSKDAKGKNRMLYLFNHGWINWITNQNQISNQSLEEADKMIDEFQKNYALEALSFLSNPGIRPYQPEDFEKVMVNYYKALNYLNLKQYNTALVEVRRINEKLNQLNDKYPDHKNRYQNDAFAHIMMGLIYEANREYNDAFIAYRNALEVYESSYQKNFNLPAPEQLKKDILRTASRIGFYEELRTYEAKFNMKYVPAKRTGGELILIWQNGMGPVKSEWSINFTKTSSQNGFVTFANEENGLSYPVYIGDKNEKEKNGFDKLSFIRVAFPKYSERKPYYRKAEVFVNDTIYRPEIAQDLNGIAFKTLQDRMFREMASAIARLAAKQALEALARKENSDFGTAVSIFNAITEKADTRNWQTLPYEIAYIRIPLIVGENKVKLTLSTPDNQQKTIELTFQAKDGETIFHVFNSLESYLPNMN